MQLKKEGVSMDFTFEVFTGIILDMAMLALVFNLVRKRAHGSAAERFTAVCMGLGFMIWLHIKGNKRKLWHF